MADPVKNFAIVTVSTGYDASATSIALDTGEASKLPDPSGDGEFNVVWWNSADYPNPADDPNAEIVRVTGVSVDTLTVTRAQESTSATTKNTGVQYKMALVVTAKTIDDIYATLVDGPASSTDNALPRFDGTTGLIVKNSVVTVDDSGNVSGLGTLASGSGTLTIDETASLSSYLQNVVDDTTPQLGGNIDVNGFTITSASNGNVAIAPNGTGDFSVNTNQIFADTSSGFVGIGNASPARALSINNDVPFMEFRDANQASSHLITSVVEFVSSAGTRAAYFGVNSSAFQISTDNQATDIPITLLVAGTEVARASTTGRFGVGVTSPDAKLHVEEDSAATNSVTDVFRMTSTSTGTPANGIGVGMAFEVETAAGNNEVGARIAAITTDVTSTSEDFDLAFYTMEAGAAATEGMRIKSTGQVEFKETAYFDAEVDNGNSGTADTIDWTAGNKQKSTLTGNVTFTFTAPGGPCNLILKLVQDGTGSRTVTWPAAVKWPSGTAPTLSTAASAVDIVSFYYDGTNYYGQAGLNFS